MCSCSGAQPGHEPPGTTAESAAVEAKAETSRRYRAKFREAQLSRQVELYERAWEECLRRELAAAGEQRGRAPAAPPVARSDPAPAAAAAALSAAAAGAAAAPAPAAPVRLWDQKVEVRFRLHFDTIPGQELHLVGSCEQLGCWDVGRGVHMAWTEGNVWTAKLVFPAGGARLEYKYVLRKADDSVDWEQGGNHVLELPSESRFLEQFDCWGSGS